MINILLRGHVPETISKQVCERLWKCLDGPWLPGLSDPHSSFQTSAFSLPASPCSKVKGLIYERLSRFTEAVSHPLPPPPPPTMLPHWFGRSVALVKQLGLTRGLPQAALTSAFRRNSVCRWHSWKARESHLQGPPGDSWVILARVKKGTLELQPANGSHSSSHCAPGAKTRKQSHCREVSDWSRSPVVSINQGKR